MVYLPVEAYKVAFWDPSDYYCPPLPLGFKYFFLESVEFLILMKNP
jgi:hypothetical protein